MEWKSGWWVWLALAVVALNFIVPIAVYDSLPSKIVMSWNLNNASRGAVGKGGVFLLPILSLIIVGMFLLIKNIDPLKRNIRKFEGWYDSFIFVMSLFLLVIELLIVLWNLGYSINIGRGVMLSLAVLLVYIAFLLKNAKQNWFVGIRTPWTLTSEYSWKKTHEMGFYVFLLLALLLALSSFSLLPANYVFYFLILAILFLITYSYVVMPKK